jgi:hypothetical protein
MVAMYFTVFPTEAESYYREIVLAEEEAEKEAERLENAVIKHVHDMNREQLEISLLTLLFEGPEWQMRRFVDEYLYPFETEVCDRIPNDAAFDPFGDESGV